jgi:hypothetical protein
MTQLDLLVFGGYVPNREYRSTISLFDAQIGSQACTGVIKLAQRWLLEFLTERGSQVNRPTRGCGFMTSFRRGRLQTEASVDAEFRFSETEILQNLADDESADTPLDEKLAAATLDRITVIPGSLWLAITLTSQAGSSRSVSVPVGTTSISRAV